MCLYENISASEEFLFLDVCALGYLSAVRTQHEQEY